ncbi:MAG TPA: hypothetical protein VFY66_11365 [Anaerolineales bacterium]|nr:hypothetical protein [Anaerolineales bacterium]
MTLKAYTHQITLNIILLLAILGCLFFQPAPALALGNGGTALPTFVEFTKAVQNSEANVLRGVYVPEVLALPIIQQPAGNASYVSGKLGEVTQFAMAAHFGNIGLLAHNHLSGSSFSKLAIGQEVRLVYGNGTAEYYVITQILQYQALEPNSQYSSFRDLTNNEMLTAEQLFNKVYRGERHVTFQTCIASTESLSWGRLFIVATPKPQIAGMNRFDPKLKP